MTTIAISYSAVAAGPVSPTALQLRMQQVVLPTGPTGDITQIADVLKLTDVTTVAGQVVTRTITFGALVNFPLRFPPGGDQAAPFRQLYTTILANALATKVTAAEPVLS